MHEQEELWVQQAQAGNQQAFNRLVEAYQRPVYNLTYRMLGNPQEAEDAAQETFLRAFSRLRQYDGSHKFSTWILSIANHHCIDRLRKRRGSQVSIDDNPVLQNLEEESPQPEENLLDQEQASELQALIEQLEPEYRTPLILRYWEDYSYEQIALIMGLTVAAVKSRLFRARKQVADLYRVFSGGDVASLCTGTAFCTGERGEPSRRYSAIPMARGAGRRLRQGAVMTDETILSPLPTQPTPEMQEDFALLMSLSLDELMDANDQQRFECYLARYILFARQWRCWQQLHHQMTVAPHIEPPPDFVATVAVRLLQKGRRQRLWQGVLFALVLVVVWLGLALTVAGLAALLLFNQANWLNSLIQNLAYFSSTLSAWFASLRVQASNLVTSPQATALCLLYIILAALLLSVWVRFLRQTTTDGEPVSEFVNA